MSEILKIPGRGSWRIAKESPTRLLLVRAGVDLKSAREKAGLTQRAAAPLLGVSQAQLARIESGTRACPQPVLDRLPLLTKT